MRERFRTGVTLIGAFTLWLGLHGQIRDRLCSCNCGYSYPLALPTKVFGQLSQGISSGKIVLLAIKLVSWPMDLVTLLLSFFLHYVCVMLFAWVISYAYGDKIGAKT